MQNSIQTIGAQALAAQYAQQQTTAQESRGAFSAALQTAMGTDGSQAEADSGLSLLSTLLPMMLTGLSSGSGQEGLLLMALLLCQSAGGSGDGLLGGLGSLLGAASSLGGWEDGGSSDTSGLFSSGMFGSTGLGAVAVAAQSLYKAYQNKEQGITAAVSTPSGQSTDTAEAVQGASAAQKQINAAALTSNVSNRNPALYRAVLDGLDVENNPRYAVNQKGTGDTYCNVYMLDATKAMGAAIPRYTDRTTGAPSTSGADNAIAMNANRISDWLNNYGPQYGWYEVTAEQAQALANRGCPAVTTWKNLEGGHGHVQMVSPSKDGTYDPERGVAVAQAGRLLRNYTYITDIYSSRMKQVQYFAHK